MSESNVVPRFAVDFSEAALDGQVSVLMRDEVNLRPDDTVELIDDEGNICPGVVMSVEKHVAWISPQFDRISLNMDFQDALRAMLHTPPAR